MITPSLFHDPPRPLPASASVTAGPPSMSILFSFPQAKKASDLLSGDQNGVSGCVVRSAPLRGFASAESSRRIQRLLFPSAGRAAKVTNLPSGESVSEAMSSQSEFMPDGRTIAADIDRE